MKKHMTKEQEFDIMKLVLDKFLWLGAFLIGYGFFKLVNLTTNFWFSFGIIVAGGIIMFLFMWLLIKEYHFMA